MTSFFCNFPQTRRTPLANIGRVAGLPGNSQGLSENCRSYALNLKDEAKEVSLDIAKYRSEKSPKAEKLFGIYVNSEWMRKQIENRSDIDEFNGHLYQLPLADAYNHFMKLTGVWFKGEMREVIRTLRQGCC